MNCYILCFTILFKYYLCVCVSVRNTYTTTTCLPTVTFKYIQFYFDTPSNTYNSRNINTVLM